MESKRCGLLHGLQEGMANSSISRKSGWSMIVLLMRRDGPGRVRRSRAFHRVPDDPVQQILRALVQLVQRQVGGGDCMATQQRVRSLVRLRVPVVERNVVRNRGE